MYGYCLVHIPTPFSPLFSFLPFSCFLHFLPARGPTRENVTVAILYYALSHLHEGTGKLRKTCADNSRPFTPTIWHLTLDTYRTHALGFQK